MAIVLSTAIPEHQARLAANQVRDSSRRQAGTIRGTLASKRFGQLSVPQKDDLLKAIALELGLIAPD
jgi:hypothetical protein